MAMTKNHSAREIHFYAHTKHGSALDTLQSLKELIANGFLASEPVRLCFDPNIKGRSSKVVTFPSTTKSESLHFTRIVKVLCILVENLSNSQTVTRRDIYYKDVDLFQSQAKVDAIVSMFCQSLKLRDFEIGAVASLKGLFYGAKVEYQFDGNVAQTFSAKEENQLIPRFYNFNSIKVLNEIDYILVVEKEAVFNLLTMDKSERRLIITGKGFPDQLTKAFVSQVSRSNPQIPLLGIADMDVFGFNILHQYRTGGDKAKRIDDNDDIVESISAPALKSISLSIFDFIKGSISTPTKKEVSMMMKMISTTEDLFTKQELQRMLFLGKKAELDSLISVKEDKAIQCARLIGRKCRKKAHEIRWTSRNV